MFFYKFICFISLVANVTKKSSKSFWDRKGLCNQFAWVGLGQKGFEAVFSSYSWDFSYRPSAALELLSVRRHHWSFSAFTVITGQLWLSSARPLLPEGQRERKRRPADAERPGCAGCLAQSDGSIVMSGLMSDTHFSYTGNFSYSFSYRFSYKIFSEQLCFSINSSVSSLL